MSEELKLGQIDGSNSKVSAGETDPKSNWPDPEMAGSSRLPVFGRWENSFGVFGCSNMVFCRRKCNTNPCRRKLDLNFSAPNPPQKLGTLLINFE
jgi:hypothetical protein